MSDDENKTVPILVGIGIGIFLLMILFCSVPSTGKSKSKGKSNTPAVTKTNPAGKGKTANLPPPPDNTRVKDYMTGGWQDKEGVWHYMEGIHSTDGLVWWQGAWVAPEKARTRYPKPTKPIPYEKRKFINTIIAAKIAAEIDYGGTGVQFTNENSIDCEDYAIKFWLNAKDQGYDARILTSMTLHHAFNAVVIEGYTYLVEPQGGENNPPDVFTHDEYYNLTDIADNTDYYVDLYLKNPQSVFKNNGPTR